MPSSQSPQMEFAYAVHDAYHQQTGKVLSKEVIEAIAAAQATLVNSDDAATGAAPTAKKHPGCYHIQFAVNGKPTFELFHREIPRKGDYIRYSDNLYLVERIVFDGDRPNNGNILADVACVTAQVNSDMAAQGVNLLKMALTADDELRQTYQSNLANFLLGVWELRAAYTEEGYIEICNKTAENLLSRFLED